MRGRIRQLKPELFLDDDFWAVTQSAPELPVFQGFAGLWCQADREGRFEWRPAMLKSQILPYWAGDFGCVLAVLEGAGLIRSYAVDGRRYGVIKSFLRHQRPNNREPQSCIPEPLEQPEAVSVSAHEPRGEAAEAPRASRPPLPTTDSQLPTPIRSSGVRPVPGLVVVAAQSRVFTMPGPEPPEDYLQRAVIENVRPAQARSTWKHYFAAGLPPGGIERLHEWLLEQARDYAVRKAAPPARASPGARPEPESEWDWRCLAQPHVNFAERHELDARAIAHRWYMTGAAKGLSATEADVAFAKHLKSLAAKPPPKRPSEPPPKEASA